MACNPYPLILAMMLAMTSGYCMKTYALILILRDDFFGSIGRAIRNNDYFQLICRVR